VIVNKIRQNVNLSCTKPTFYSNSIGAGYNAGMSIAGAAKKSVMVVCLAVAERAWAM